MEAIDAGYSAPDSSLLGALGCWLLAVNLAVGKQSGLTICIGQKQSSCSPTIHNLYTHVRRFRDCFALHVPNSLLCPFLFCWPCFRFCAFCFHSSNWKCCTKCTPHPVPLGVAVRWRRLIKNCLLQVMDVQHGFDLQPSVPGSQSKAKQKGTFQAFPGPDRGAQQRAAL